MQPHDGFGKSPASRNLGIAANAYQRRLEYVLITPAHNEEAHIERTIQTVLAQTAQPLRWIIVDDCSDDRTADIVAGYVATHNVLRLVRTKRPPGRHFGNKVAAFDRGRDELKEIGYEFIANLDADVSLEPTYFEDMLAKFARDPHLGVAGGMVYSLINKRYVSQNVALDSVAGAVQMFRRECFEDIGGYVPLAHGGIDSAAEITARKKGWAVRTFPEHRVLEHRRTGSTTSSVLAARMKEGRLYHSLGYSFPFFLFRCLYRVREQPPLLGSLAELLGFLAGVVSRKGFVLQSDVVQHLRTEQRRKLKVLLRR